MSKPIRRVTFHVQNTIFVTTLLIISHIVSRSSLASEIQRELVIKLLNRVRRYSGVNTDMLPSDMRAFQLKKF